MKKIVFLVVTLLVGALLVETSPAFGELTGAEYEQITAIVTTANEKQTKELKAYVDAKIDASEKAMTAEIRALEKAMTAEIRSVKETTAADSRAVKEEVKVVRATQHWWIGVLVVLLVAALGFFYRQLSDVQRTLGQLLARTESLAGEWEKRFDALATQQMEIAALRAENESLKNAPELVSRSGQRLKSDDIS
ncbi:hypothetical protein C6495_03350 [Candidatus Poribacteria bacterium]|nr:MAG: hypothetical protein C6495_03350 [Candidatus Poribacteria bacterium]